MFESKTEKQTSLWHTDAQVHTRGSGRRQHVLTHRGLVVLRVWKAAYYTA